MKKIMIRVDFYPFYLSVIMFLFFSNCSYQYSMDNELDKKVDSIFEDLSSLDSPGASVAVIRQGKIELRKQYGNAQIEYSLPVKENTIFHVASVSKQFTAMSIMLLAYDGELSLDDQVQQYLPYVPKYNYPVTIRQMLQMTSGIRDQWELLAISGWRLDDVITTDHVLQLIQRQKRLNFEPNTKYMYSNMGYTLLGQIIESVSGKTLAQFARERIFEPLGMSSTHFHDDHEHIVKDRAYSYKKDKGKLKKSILSYANVGATSLFTTAIDLVKWLDNFRHTDVGGAALLDEMQLQGVLNNGEKIAYAHGIVIGDYKGLKTVSHGGADAGFRSHVVWFPEKEVGIVVLTNLASAGPKKRAYQIADLLLEEEFSQYSAPEGQNELQEVEVDDETLDSIIGRYQLDSGMIVELYKRWSSVYARVADQSAMRLIPVSDKQFWIKDLEMILAFEIGDVPADNSFTVFTQTGEKYGEGVHIPPFTVSERELKILEGQYYSPELEAVYNLSKKDNLLIATHVRHGKIKLKPIFKNQFNGDKWFFSSIRFLWEDDNAISPGNVTGFLLSGGRVQNLKFIKLRNSLPTLSSVPDAPSIPERPFPEPTGVYSVGMTDYFWTDDSREEIFTKVRDDSRNILVRAWYPTITHSGKKAMYVSNLSEFGTNKDFDKVQHVRTSAIRGSPPVRSAGRFPVLIYNHGGGWTRFTSTFTTEELASHGYVVFSVGHNGFNKTQLLPNGESIKVDTLSSPEPTGDLLKDALTYWDYLDEHHFPQWVADARFVIDKITELNEEGRFNKILDLDKIGMYGWSFGGATSIKACIVDERIKAAVDHDGQLFGDAEKEVIKAPFMLFHSGIMPEAPKGKDDQESRKNKKIMDELIKMVSANDQQLKTRSKNDWYDVTIKGAAHGHFSDLVLLYPEYAGDLKAFRAYEIINSLTVSFFDYYLKKEPSKLLDNPKTIFPEVILEKNN